MQAHLLRRTMSAASSVGVYESKIIAMGLALPPASKPVASYVMATRVGNLIYTGARAPWSACPHPMHPLSP